MYQEQQDLFYYITLYNENYAQPHMPEGAQEGILRGIYKFRSAANPQMQLFGSGPILNEALQAQEILQEKYGIAADVWSVTSYNELRREALRVDRWNRLHPTGAPRKPYLVSAIEGTAGPIVAASDYMKLVPDMVSPWLGSRLVTLGTDGFGRSDNRQHLRDHFEVNAASIAAAALATLAREGKFGAADAAKAIGDLGVDPEKTDPALA